MTKGDIDETLKHVCKKVLLDKSVSEHTRTRRASALLVLGEQYLLRRVQDMNGINDFLERIGKQTGIFTDEKAEFNPFAPNGSSGCGEGENGQPAAAPPGGAFFFSDALSKDELLAMISKLDTASVRELKECIAALGGDSSHCIEKEDLKRHLSELLLIKLAAIDMDV